MSKTFFDTAVSLDGFMAGPNAGVDNPLGDNGPDLHNWMFVQKAFWDIHGMNVENQGQEDSADGVMIRKTFERTGACIMGKRMFEEGEPRWPEDLFKCDVFVLTQEKREPWVQMGTTTFYFINDGIDAALERAKKSAGKKDIRVLGGAETIQQYLNAGLIDECLIHVTPMLLKKGIRLFENVAIDSLELKIQHVSTSSLTTHMMYSLRNKTN